ncbi:MAG: PadR family transcriptional regulator [Candidatus Thorarchaeota archaeon]
MDPTRRPRWEMVVEAFRKKGALSPKTAITLEDLGVTLPPMLLDERFKDLSPIVRVKDKYYLSEERLSSLREKFGPWGALRQWVQHTASVPKGYLRVRVLQLLKERPMSGAEIADAIEAETDGRWRPKPGSIYPLLKSFLEQGLTVEVPAEDDRTRRYALTPKGEELYDLQVARNEQIRAKLKIGSMQFLPPPFMLAMPERLSHLREPIQRLFGLFFEFRELIQDDESGEVAETVTKLLDETVKKYERVLRRLKEQSTSSRAKKRRRIRFLPWYK